GLALESLRWMLAHGDDLGCVMHRDGQARDLAMLELLAQAGLVPDHNDLGALAGRGHRSLQLGGGRVIAAHGVDRDPHLRIRLPRRWTRPLGLRSSRSCCTADAAAWVPGSAGKAPSVEP